MEKYEGIKVDLKKQSIELEGGVRTSIYAPDGKLIETLYEDVKTSYDSFCRGRKISPKGNCLGARRGPKEEYVWLSYDETHERAHQLASGFMQLGLSAGNDTFVGIYALNSPEWVVTSVGCMMMSMVSVPLYDTLGAEACSYIINQADLSLVVCDTAARVEALLDNKSATPSLATIVMVNLISDELKKKAEAADVKLISFQEVVDLGASNIQEITPPKADDLLTICYTSGTTGNPKGAMITHANLVADTAAMTVQGYVCNADDVHFSYLPLAHIFERLIQECMYLNGGSVGFYRGDVKLLIDDMQILKPTGFPIVPRLLNKIYDKVQQGVQGSAIKRFLFNLALRKKTELVRKGVVTRTSIWDKLVFGKIQALIGGRVRCMCVGAAPTTPEIIMFARCAFGCAFYEGYGQTECTGGMSTTLDGESEGGHVGTPAPCNLVKLVDIPDMDYFAKDGKGEVCCKGYNVMKGYYKEPKKTAEALDEEGWLHTGDVGQWLPNGTLKLIDRKKHIFKLAQGEYVAPEKVEAIYNRGALVAQTFVDAHSEENYPVGIVVPDEEVIPGWANKHNLKNVPFAELCKNDKLKSAIMEEMKHLAKDAKLKGFEQVKDIYIHHELFSIENGLLTPTFKSKRPQLRKYFAEQINAMYAKLKEQQDANNRNTDAKM